MNKKTKNSRKKHKKNINRIKALNKKSLLLAKKKPQPIPIADDSSAKKASAKNQIIFNAALHQNNDQKLAGIISSHFSLLLSS